MARPLVEQRRKRFAATMRGSGVTVPERDDAMELCIYCCTEPQSPDYEPYCSGQCASNAGRDNELDE